MKNWMKSLETLAGKLTAILAFAALIIIVLALIGERIPEEYRALVYVTAIGAMIIFTLQIFMRYRVKSPKPQTLISKSVSSNESQSKQEISKVASADAREIYLSAVIADCRSMRLVGLDPQAADPSRGGLTLESLYVSLNTTTAIDKSGKIKSGKKSNEEEERGLLALGREEMRPLSALEALFQSENRRMVLLGLPGTGKSTFARYLALRVAQAELDRSQNIQDLLPGWKSGVILPLLLSLGRMAETISSDCKKGSAVLLENYIKQTLQNDERTADFAEYILPELEHTGGLVLFDGLDEVADLRLRPIVVQAVEGFVQKYGKQSASRFLVTCRTYSYSHDSKWQLTGWATHELALLDEEKINYFINAWHDEHIRIEPARKSDLEHKREQLLLSLQPDDRRRLHEIAPFPIILTMMAVVHTHYGELPDTRAEVYDRCVDLLLVRWELERSVDGQSKETKKRNIIDELGLSSRGVLDRALREIAYKAHEGREDDGQNKRGPALVTEELLTSILYAQFQSVDKVKIFLDYCRSSNGLLMLQGSVIPADAPEGSPPRNVYAFPHLTFEEYLAARYLVGPNIGRTTFELVQKSDRWREVVMLLGEFLCFFQGGDLERMENLLNAFTPKNIPTDREHSVWRAVWYSGDLLSLFHRAFPRETFSRETEIKNGLYKLINIGALSPRERASAADTLDELSYVVLDAFTFLPVSIFAISKYLITNTQYERFLKPENFQNKSLWINFPKYDENSKPMEETWGEEPWDWLQKKLQDKDNDIQDGVLPPRFWRDPRFGINRRHAPVVGVSWYEASAYCNWLLQSWDGLDEGKQGLPKPKWIRLPLEKEWSLAAGGEANERFAFGELKDPKKEIMRYANTTESGINRTTPVWMYPQGASPTGAMDMSGNVWEWQANYRDVKNRYLGLRGGSWFNGVVGARVSVRDFDRPLGRNDVIGFRVDVSLPNG